MELPSHRSEAMPPEAIPRQSKSACALRRKGIGPDNSGWATKLAILLHNVLLYGGRAASTERSFLRGVYQEESTLAVSGARFGPPFSEWRVNLDLSALRSEDTKRIIASRLLLATEAREVFSQRPLWQSMRIGEH